MTADENLVRTRPTNSPEVWPCHPHRRWVPVAVFVASLLTQLAWAWGTPPFRGMDEIDHAFRASSVAHGELGAIRLTPDQPGVLVEVSPGLATDARAQCEALASKRHADCVPEKRLPNGDVLILSTAASYSPVFYAVVGLAAKPWDGATALYVMRGTASLVNAVLLALATWCLLVRSRTRWPLAGLLVGLTPMASYTLMLPAPNGIELSASAVLWCGLLALQGADDRFQGRLLTAVGVAGAILGSVRTSGPVFILLIVGFVSLVGPRRTWETARSRWKGVVGVAIVTAAATLYQTWWTLDHPPLAGLEGRAPLDMGLILEQVVLWPFQWIGAFPYRNQPASSITYAATGGLMLLIWTIGLRLGGSKRWIAVGVVATCLVIPFFYTLATFPELGTIWQGRYALPLLIGAPLLICIALDEAGGRMEIMRWLVPSLGMVSSAAALVHMVNQESMRPASASDPHWQQPSTTVLILLAAATAVVFDRALAWAGSAPDRSDD